MVNINEPYIGAMVRVLYNYLGDLTGELVLKCGDTLVVKLKRDNPRLQLKQGQRVIVNRSRVIEFI